MHSHGSPKYNNPGPRQASEQRHLGSTWPRRLVCLPRNAPLFLPHIINPQDRLITRLQHNRFLPIKVTTTKPLPSGFSDICSSRSNKIPPKSHSFKPNYSSWVQADFGNTSARSHIQHSNSAINYNPPGATNSTYRHDSIARSCPCKIYKVEHQGTDWNNPWLRFTAATPKGVSRHP